MKERPANGWDLKDLTAPQKDLLLTAHLRGVAPSGAQLSVASELIRMRLIEPDEDVTRVSRFICTDEGNALAQRQIDQQHDDDQEMWNERDDLRAKRDRLKQELAAVEKRLKVLEAMPS